MNSKQLLTHFNRIAEAPDAILRLRRFILDLAVRGKLVPQDPKDEPASKLLQRIQAEKGGLVKEGKMKKGDELPPVGAQELSFELPAGWCATRLEEIAACLNYMREPINGTEREQRIAGKTQDELYPYYGATQQQGWIDDFIFDEELILLGEDGVPFFDDLRPKAYLITGKSWVNNHAHVFRGILVSNLFILHCLNTLDYTGRVAGATRGKLNKSKAVEIPIPLPPLAEQRRIVAKVTELMGLCDRLEAAQTEREQRRDRLAAATHAGLSTPEPRHSSFFLRHFPHFTTRPDQIPQLRQTILNFAVRGRLVPQDPKDEPAKVLLKRIQVEKERQANTGELRKQQVLDVAVRKETLFSIPESWSWTKMDACFAVSGGIQKTPARKPKNNPHPYIGVSNVYRGRLDLSEVKQFDLLDGEMERFRLVEGDILVVEGNGSANEIGRCAMWTGEINDCVHQNHIIRCRSFHSGITPFVLWYLNSPDGIEVMKEMAVTSSGLYSLSVGKIRTVIIPLPPLAEQQRIVAKVEDLMALCDQMETQLHRTQTESRRLLASVLHEALAA